MQGKWAEHYYLQQRSVMQFGFAQIMGLFQQQVLGEIAMWQEFAKQLRNISKAKGYRGKVNDLMHQVAYEGHAATLRAYRPKGPSAYRFADPDPYRRDSGGVMKRLLESDKWYSVHRDGITWILPEVFDKTARQWYRLNFGAQPAQQRYPKGGMMRFFDKNIGYGPDLNSAPTSTRFFKPPGVRSNQALSKTPPKLSDIKTSNSGRAFYPAGAAGPGAKAAYMGKMEDGKYKYDYQSAKLGNIPTFTGRRATKGIVGMRFFDAGLQQIGRALPAAMEQLVYDMVTEAAKGAKEKKGMALFAKGSYDYQGLAEKMHAEFMKGSSSRMNELRYNMAAANRDVESAYLQRLAVLAKM